MNPGIDKLTIQTKDFRLTSLDGWGRSLSAEVGKPIPLLEGIEANRLFRNEIGINCTINNKGLVINFNPSKIHFGNDTYQLLTTGKEFNAVIDTLHDRVKDAGILMDWNTAGITRMDLTKQAEMQYPFVEYESAFRSLSLPRTKRNGFAGETYSYRNGARELQFYDKGAEMNLELNNLMRAENKAKTRDAMKSLYKTDRLTDIKQLTPAELNTIYSNYIQRNLFNKVNAGQQQLIWTGDELEWRNFAKQNPKDALLYFGMDKIVYLVQKLGIDRFMDMYRDATGIRRETAWRQKSKLQQKINSYKSIPGMTITPGELIHELIHKFAA